MKVQEIPFKTAKFALELCQKNKRIKLQNEDKLTQAYLLNSTKNRYQHYKLYDFWSRSEGIWFSNLVKVAVRLLDAQEVLAVSQIHDLEQAEFGIRMSWEYNTKAQSGQMSWCVDANLPGRMFTDKSLSSNNPQIVHYQLVNDNQLVTTAGKYEETFLLKSDSRRLRELRYDGKLVRRLWENKFAV